MAHRRIIETYYRDVNNLADLLNKLVNSYRLLVGGANELNGIALASKSDIKDALKRAHELGDIIDGVIEALEVTTDSCNCYCKLKGEILGSKIHIGYIETEIGEDLKLQN
jgi:hypothetical protein